MKNQKTILEEWQEMKYLPYLEFEINNKGERDYLLVEIAVEYGQYNTEIKSNNLKYFFFTFDTLNLKTLFSNNIEKHCESYKLKIDPKFNLDNHLKIIYQEIMNGFIIPNNLDF
jgi:hypothetical protein